MTDCRFRDCRELDVCLERLGQTKITDDNLGTDSHDCKSAFAWWFLSAQLVWYHFVLHIDGLRKKPWWLCRHFGLASSNLRQPHRAMPCALCLCDSVCAEPTKGFSCSSCGWTCRLCVPGQFSSDCTSAFAGFETGVSPSIDAGLCMFLSCEFLLFCPSNYPAIMLPGVHCLNEKWCPKCLALRPTFSAGLKERERSMKQWSTKLNQIMWNKYYCDHLRSCYMISHHSLLKVYVYESR